MQMQKIDDALQGVIRLGLDTSPVIYFVEANPVYDARVTDIFQRFASFRLIGVTSVITLCEVLVHPVAHGDKKLQQAYRDLLLHSDNFFIRLINPTIAEQAAELRAHHRLRTPDALQIAAALNSSCEAFLTNDSNLKRVTELRVLALDELEL
jgi:predicted nucleic acid-binding protein